MARIEGVDLPRNKRIEVGLTYIFGIGPTRANEILAATSVNPDVRVKDLTETDVSALREYISKNFKVEGDLRRDVQMNIKRLVEIGCYRGLRHRRVYQSTVNERVPTHAPVKARNAQLQDAVVGVAPQRNKPEFGFRIRLDIEELWHKVQNQQNVQLLPRRPSVQCQMHRSIFLHRSIIRSLL